MGRTLTGREARREARIAGAWYLGTFVTGIGSLAVPNGLFVGNLLSTACYLGVTFWFYRLFRPVNPGLSGLAAVVSLAGCAQSVMTQFHVEPVHFNPLALFGVYCMLVGLLIYRSGYLPRGLGIAMGFGGVAWLTFASHSLGRQLAPWNMATGILAEGALTVWLLVKGVDTVRWEERTGGLPVD